MSKSFYPLLVVNLVEILKTIFVENVYADKALERAFKAHKNWGVNDRQFLAERTYEMVRWWGRLCAYDGLPFELLDDNEFYTRWLTFEIWKGNGPQAENTVLNKLKSKLSFDQIRNSIKHKKFNLEEEFSFPNWIIKEVKNNYPQDFNKLLNSLNNAAPVCLRVNTLKTGRKELIEILEADGLKVASSERVPSCITLLERENVFRLKAFKDGLFEVQDEASQMVAPYLEVEGTKRVADCCAGAGGKTLHLAALMNNKGQLVAMDVLSRKLDELSLRAKRAGVSNLRVMTIESTKDIKRHIEGFDRVLIDAPCTGSGVIRRNPDSKWKMKISDLENLIKTQSEILSSYSRMVKPGGKLVYATCSIFKSENEDIVNKFLSENKSWQLDGPSVKLLPHTDGTDGFFAQRLVKG